MKTITLIIGGVDMSEYTVASEYSVHKNWKTKTNFENYDGKQIIRRAGWSYHIRAGFDGEIPDVVMAELAKALNANKIVVTFTDPHSTEENGCTTMNFEKPESIGGEITAERADGLYWDTIIDLTSVFSAATDGDSL